MAKEQKEGTKLTGIVVNAFKVSQKKGNPDKVYNVGDTFEVPADQEKFFMVQVNKRRIKIKK